MEFEKNKENFVKFVYDDSINNVPTHSNLENSLGLEGSLDQGYQCLSCPKVFEHKQSLSKHVKVHKGGEGHVCPQCSKKFVAYRDLKKHVDIVHLNKAEEYKKQCPICNIRVQQLKTHIRFIHRNEGKISEYSGKCPHCKKTFSDDYKVKRHIETVHEGIKHWQCKLCPKRFYERKDLGRHVRGVHMGEKVDTWKNKKNLDTTNLGLNIEKMEEEAEPNVANNNHIAPTVDDVSTSINLPVNVLAEEGDDKNDIAKDMECEELVDDPLVIDDEGMLDVDEETETDDDLRFQVCAKRIDDNGDIVLQIVEKEPVKTNSKMVTLRWGNNGDKEDSNSNPSNNGQENCKVIQRCNTEDKIMDLNLKLEDIVHYSKEGVKQLDDDFMLPEVVGDFHNWLDEDLVKDRTKEEARTAFKCGACAKMFVSLDFLKSHIEKTHIKITEDSTTNKLVETEENNKKNSPVEDKKTNISVDKIVCDFEGCDAKFTGKGRRLQQKRHVERKHMSIRDKKCPKCELSFYEKRDLSRHVEAVHLKVRTMCPVEGCGRPVVRLDQHIKLVHSDKSPVKSQCKCEECGASFGRIYDLTRHKENVHRGYKNFACDKCDRRFSDKRDLKRHHDAVHLNIKQTKVYTCNICLTNFKFKKHLDSHRLTEHTDDTATEVIFSQEPSNSPQLLIQQLETNVRSTDVVISVNNIPQSATNGEDDLISSQEFSTVDVDGQLFLVQQGPAGISLLPVLQTITETTLPNLSETSSVSGYT